MIQNNFNNKISLCKFENDDKLDGPYNNNTINQLI